MASRLVQRHKKSTMLVTERTLNQAMYEAKQLVSQLGHQDPRAKELQQLYNDIAPYARGAGSSEQYDDAVNPEIANELKQAVDRIRQLRNEGSQPAAAPAQVPAQAPAQQPVRASAKAAHGNLECPLCEHGGFKNQQELDAHVDEAHKGRLASKNANEGAPMSSKLFARKKKRVEAEDEMLDAAPEAIAGDAPTEPLPEEGLETAPAPEAAPAPAPAAAPPTAGNPFANLPTEALSAIVESLTNIDQFESNPAILGAIEDVAEELKNRPMQPAVAEGTQKAASRVKVGVTPPGISESLMHKLKKEYPGNEEAAYATAWKIHDKKESSTDKTAVAPPGRESQVKALKKNPEVDNPYAVAWHSYDESHEGASDAPPTGWEGAATSLQSAGGLTPAGANVLAHWMKDQGYTPHKAAFMIRRNRTEWLKSKFAASSQNAPFVNEDTLNKVEGQPHEVPEIGEAHGDREGVAEAEKHNSNPGDSVATITRPQELNKTAAETEVSKALKTAESLEKKLGELYLDAKPIIRANASAAVRDAVESIYDAKNKFAEAKKVLNKHEMQAAAEEEAQKQALEKEKKASAVKSPAFGLSLVAAE